MFGVEGREGGDGGHTVLWCTGKREVYCSLVHKEEGGKDTVVWYTGKREGAILFFSAQGCLVLKEEREGTGGILFFGAQGRGRCIVH